MAEMHPDFKRCTWRGTTNTDGKIIGVSFDMPDGSIVRLRMELACAINMAECVLEFAAPYRKRTGSHSKSSSGKPSVDVSHPEE